MKIGLFVAALLTLLCGCTTLNYEPLEYTVPASRLETREALVAGFSDAKYRINTDSDFTLLVERYQTPGEMVFSNNLKIFYQFAITGDNPTKISPRIIATFGNPLSPGQVDVTHREDLRKELEAKMAAITSGLKS
ncbi:hypothetical protein [Rhizobium alvei]|uniref:Lipoprotein n=1 Tax=Rhizobium alvei TaxID=1132659 RepID=A0ABT8YTH6_9HYPH|nr:hypothetical protein [Rhizobium alvei]MDO6966989.1 hypothetical protein [Rhizobium alvei]